MRAGMCASVRWPANRSCFSRQYLAVASLGESRSLPCTASVSTSSRVQAHLFINEILRFQPPNLLWTSCLLFLTLQTLEYLYYAPYRFFISVYKKIISVNRSQRIFFSFFFCIFNFVVFLINMKIFKIFSG